MRFHTRGLSTLALLVGLAAIGSHAYAQTAATGDVNLDGIVDILDAELAARLLINGTASKAQVARTDFNQDGILDVEDIQLLLELVVQQTAMMPVPPLTGTAECVIVPKVAGPIDVADAAVEPNGTVTVEVRTIGATSMAGAVFVLSFDPKVLRFSPAQPGFPENDVTLGPALISPLVAVDARAAAGRIVVGLVTTLASRTSGAFFTIPLIAAADAPNTTTQVTVAAAFTNEERIVTGITLGNGVITIGHPDRSAGCANPPSVLQLGDVDGDGVIDLKDVTTALRFLVGVGSPSAAQAAVLDVNGDGQFTLADVVLILKFALHLIDRFPKT